MADNIKLLDTVALLEEMADRQLAKGQMGTVVEVLAPDVFEVEFSDSLGRTFGMVTLRSEKLMLLHKEPLRAA